MGQSVALQPHTSVLPTGSQARTRPRAYRRLPSLQQQPRQQVHAGICKETLGERGGSTCKLGGGRRAEGEPGDGVTAGGRRLPRGPVSPPGSTRSPYPSVICESWMGASSSTWLQRCARPSSLWARKRSEEGGVMRRTGMKMLRTVAAYSCRALKSRWHTSRTAPSSLPSRDTSCSSSPTASTSSSTDSKSAPLLCRIPAGTRRCTPLLPRVATAREGGEGGGNRDTAGGKPPPPRLPVSIPPPPHTPYRDGSGAALTRHVGEDLAVQLGELAAEDVGARRHGAAGAGPGPHPLPPHGPATRPEGAAGAAGKGWGGLKGQRGMLGNGVRERAARARCGERPRSSAP